MAKQEFIDIGNTSKGWNFGVYPDLLETSLYSFSRRPLRSPAFQIAVLERSFASATCALAAFQIEGMLQKISLEQGGGDDRKAILSLLKNAQQRAAVIELFVLRDVIAHGHIYKTTVRLKDDGLPRSSYSKKLTKYESNDFKQVVSQNKTRLMRFNVNPARIGFCDAVLALGVTNEVYKELENRSEDMPMNKFTENEGYKPRYFTAYIQQLLKGLDKSHVNAVKSKLTSLEKFR